MHIEYVARNYHLDDATRDFAEDKLGKVTRFLEEPVEIRLTLEVEKHRQIADLHVAHKLGVLQAAEATGAMRDAINLAVDKVERQARRARKKLVGRRRKMAERPAELTEWPLEVLEAASVSAGNEPRVIKSSVLQIKPMSVDEAALQLKHSKNDFVVFRDAASEQVSVLYKRKDQNYGLISPE